MKTPGTFTAQYYGQCSTCEQPIVPGDSCRYEDDQIVHAKDCNPYSRRVEQRSATICPKCFLQTPCECDA